MNVVKIWGAYVDLDKVVAMEKPTVSVEGELIVQMRVFFHGTEHPLLLRRDLKDGEEVDVTEKKPKFRISGVGGTPAYWTTNPNAKGVRLLARERALEEFEEFVKLWKNRGT